MYSEKRIDRLAGALYLVVVVTGIFGLAYVPSRISTSGGIESVISHIAASEQLFRLGIASLLINQVAFLLLPLALLGLLHDVNRKAAIAMVALAFASIPVMLVAIAHRLDTLSFVTSSTQAADSNLLHAQATLSLASYQSTLLVTNLFWGLWLLPLGYLILKSCRIPRLLGIFLILGGLGYCTNVFGTILLPGYENSAFSDYATLPAALGEIGTALWLLVFGAKQIAARPN